MRFVENNVSCIKYIDIHEFRAVQGGTYIFHCTYFVYYSQKRKKVQEHDLY